MTVLKFPRRAKVIIRMPDGTEEVAKPCPHYSNWEVFVDELPKWLLGFQKASGLGAQALPDLTPKDGASDE